MGSYRLFALVCLTVLIIGLPVSSGSLVGSGLPGEGPAPSILPGIVVKTADPDSDPAREIAGAAILQAASAARMKMQQKGGSENSLPPKTPVRNFLRRVFCR